ncbi:hypothetical protein [Singulisphaera sp. PoT]|uniref:hypothetical protein n=1 Tax=Singulisphaera sp. PoT TaxID=3411797 RepID=UPI003BF604AE
MPRRQSPAPPRPTDRPIRVPLSRLWPSLPEAAREHLLLTLSRVIRQQQPPPPAAGVSHE